MKRTALVVALLAATAVQAAHIPTKDGALLVVSPYLRPGEPLDYFKGVFEDDPARHLEPQWPPTGIEGYWCITPGDDPYCFVEFYDGKLPIFLAPGESLVATGAILRVVGREIDPLRFVNVREKVMLWGIWHKHDGGDGEGEVVMNLKDVCIYENCGAGI